LEEAVNPPKKGDRLLFLMLASGLILRNAIRGIVRENIFA